MAPRLTHLPLNQPSAWANRPTQSTSSSPAPHLPHRPWSELPCAHPPGRPPLPVRGSRLRLPGTSLRPGQTPAISASRASALLPTAQRVLGPCCLLRTRLSLHLLCWSAASACSLDSSPRTAAQACYSLNFPLTEVSGVIPRARCMNALHAGDRVTAHVEGGGGLDLGAPEQPHAGRSHTQELRLCPWWTRTRRGSQMAFPWAGGRRSRPV